MHCPSGLIERIWALVAVKRREVVDAVVVLEKGVVSNRLIVTLCSLNLNIEKSLFCDLFLRLQESLA